MDKETKAKQEDLAKREKSFNEKLTPLLAEHRLGIGAVAFLLPDGRIGARPQLVDVSEINEKKDNLVSED